MRNSRLLGFSVFHGSFVLGTKCAAAHVARLAEVSGSCGAGEAAVGERVVGMDGQGVVERGKRETQATSKHTKLRGNNA